jgi:predicted O-methyltransferase YrrM
MKTFGWFDFADFYDFALSKFNKGIFVEIGTWKGQSISYLAHKIQDSRKKIKIYGIDTFEGTPEDYALLNDEELIDGTLFETYLKTINKYSDIITTIKGDSHVVYDRFEDRSIDFLFIDGDHRYEGIKKDLEVWYQKVKIGGIISGHDYETTVTCGVRKAVDEAFPVNVFTMGRCWYYKKIS